MSVITSIEDLRVLAKKRVPRMFYDYADSGAWTEQTYRANTSDFEKIRLRQRVAVNMEGRSLAGKMVGQFFFQGGYQITPAEHDHVPPHQQAIGFVVADKPGQFPHGGETPAQGRRHLLRPPG